MKNKNHCCLATLTNLVKCWSSWGLGNVEYGIEFPIKDLNISDIVHRYFREFYNESYNLHGVSIHYGTLHRGHYTANIKNITEDWRWYNCDDAFTKEIDLPKTSGEGPYVLFYHRQDVVNEQD